MSKQAAIECVVNFQRDRAAKAKNWTPEAQVKFDRMLSTLVTALDAQPDSWYASLQGELKKATDYGHSHAYVYLQAIKPHVKFED
jgi:hypothetical protein